MRERAMNRIIRLPCILGVAAALGTPVPALAQRVEKVTQVRMARADSCPMVQRTAILPELNEAQKEFFPAPIAMLFAGIAGNLVQSGLTAAGDALEQASKEKGFVAEASTSYRALRLLARGADKLIAEVKPRETCLILFSQGDGPGIDDLLSEKALIALNGLERDKLRAFRKDEDQAVIEELKGLGLRKVPSVYVEAYLLNSDEGTQVRPVLVWYRDKLSGATSKESASEYHVTFSTPSASEGGTAFAVARLLLPRIAPGRALGPDGLAASKSLVVPLRPNAGFVDGRLTAANLAYAQEATRKRELVVATRGLEAARRKFRGNTSQEANDTITAAQQAETDAKENLRLASEAADTQKDENVGVTNVKSRFVVIREPNQFGLALAKALKGQADAAGKAVTTALSPQPDWTTSDTAYISAETALAAKQREYDAAVLGGKTDDALRLSGELEVLKAKVNEAAVAIKRPIPYLSLLKTP